jgi:lysophospholipase L1-like esterase
MNRANKVIGWLLVLIGISINPFTLSKLFSNDGNITTLWLIVAVVCVEFLFVLFGITLTTRRVAESVSNAAFGLVSTVVVIALTISADRFYGAFLMPETADILFPAFSKAKQKTSEFDLTVNINNLGFRGENTSVRKSKKRVLLIGDSFTFGWGVELEETWVSLLSENYPEVEFLNLGQGGNHPGDYVRVVKNALPILQPDFILVGVLEGNDIHQLMRVIEFEETGKTVEAKAGAKESRQAKVRRYLGLVFPNIARRVSTTVSIQERWQTDADTLLQELNTDQLKKYQSIDPALRDDFENGFLNPSLIYESLHHPDWVREAADTTSLLCNKGIIRLADHLQEIASLTKQSDSELLFVSLPNRPYRFSSEGKALDRLGFNVGGCDTLDGSLPTRVACTRANIPLLEPVMQGDSLFYEFDGHWNANGNRIFAKQLKIELDSLPQWKRFLTL